MSGSSLDGLDIAYTEFWQENDEWHYNLIKGETIPYSSEWAKILKNIRNYPAAKLIEIHHGYGKFLGELTLRFIDKHALKPDLVASHGHTVFHNPARGYTFQLGYGQAIASKTGITTIADFRTKDITLGGQGAPLVPIGDELLFNDFKACINLGGIANISFSQKGKRIAFDVVPANQLLNFLAGKAGLEYDNDGKLASKGKMIENLHKILSADPYYQKPVPKSLSNEYVAESFIPLPESINGTTEDKLYTVTHHIAEQLNKALSIIEPAKKRKILITGGGAKNRFLIEQLKKICSDNIVLPSTLLIDFKEAMIFALMGVLRLNKKVNCLASATGAVSDSSSGIIFLP